MTFRRKAIIWFILFCMVAGGILAFRSISKLEDPELVVMQSQIVTVYPGASAHEVEMQVTNIIEEELNTLGDVETIRSKSMPNISIVSVMLELTVPQDEIEQRWDFLRRRMNEVVAKLPAGVQPPMVYDDFGDVYGMFYAMTGDGYSYKEMSKMARFIRRELLAVDGVARVETYGVQEPVTEIVFTPSKMGELGVYPFQVLSALSGENSMVYPGALQTGNKLLPVSVNGKIASADDVANVMLKGLDGSLFKLSDIAEVNEVYPDPPRNTMHLNNKEAIAISLSMESGENIVEVGRRVEKRLAELQKNIPVGYEFEKVFFQPDLVNNAINGFMKNLIASVLIVIVVLMVSMGLRSGLIIGTGLVLTILATFPILLAAGGTLQRISLGAFIVAMGMLVDNAIVVIDGILVDLKKGVKWKKALIHPATRTAWPLFGATFIAVAAFLPVFLSQDAAGTYARDLFVVLCISLFISWALAMTQVPLFAEKLLKRRKKKDNEELYHSWGYRKFRNILGLLLHYKSVTLIVAVLLLALAGLNFNNIKKTFFPDFNYNQVYIEYRLPGGAGPQKVQDDLHEITDYLLSLDEVKQVVSSHGQTPTRYCLVRPMGEAADNYGELIVDFEDYETMMRMKSVLSDYLHNNYPDARSRIKKYNLSIKASHTVEVEFTGPDPEVLRDLSSQAQEIFRNNPYADPYTIEDDWEPMGQALTANYAQQSARRAGTTRSDVSNAILSATEGLPIGEYFEGQTRVGIVMKLRNNDGSRIENLEDIPVWSMMPNLSGVDESTVQELMTGIKSVDELTGELVRPVPLSAVTQGVDLDWREQVVRRVNGQRAIQVQCEPLEDYSPALVRKTMLEDIKNIPLPDGYKAVWVGEHELQGDALHNIFRYLPISIMLIILTLILLFNDFRKPLIVLSCIPMAFIGIVPGMILAGQPFTFMAIIGSFGLMGMIVKNAIVLLDEAETLIAAGAEKYHALIDATISRTRPVLLASFTTILGMIPLLGDPMYASMAVAIISGLLVGTLITLVFVPILYAAFYGVKRIKEPETTELPS
ncbi:efflux RND transporter permease subunit [Tangfeifania diversioriginum]|nr:efflux RND transporter permease subunit [Tangfeifania diversioriginum]